MSAKDLVLKERAMVFSHQHLIYTILYCQPPVIMRNWYFVDSSQLTLQNKLLKKIKDAYSTSKGVFVTVFFYLFSSVLFSKLYSQALMKHCEA